MIMLIFSFKNNFSFSILSIYLPSNNEMHRQLYNDICHKIYQHYKINKYHNNHYSILQGNLNINYLKTKAKKDKNIDFNNLVTNNRWKDSITMALLQEILTNSTKYFKKEASFTHFPDATDKAPSVIDYVFVSKNSLTDLLEFSITAGQYSFGYKLITTRWNNPTNFKKNHKIYTDNAKHKCSHNELYNITGLLKDDWTDIHNQLNN